MDRLEQVKRLQRVAWNYYEQAMDSVEYGKTLDDGDEPEAIVSYWANTEACQKEAAAVSLAARQLMGVEP